MRKIFRKIHLWLSIPLGIIVCIICFSGAMLVFQDEIEEGTNPDKYFVENNQESPLPVGKLIKIVSSKIEGNSVSSIEIPSDPNRSYTLRFKEGNRASIYVNPYTGDITGKSERGDGFFSVVQRLHRWLLGGKGCIGQSIVGYTTLFMVFILISGLVIWFPKNRKQIKSRFQIKTKYGIKRFWMDLHTSGSIYIVLGLLVLSLTGLYYSFDWYRKGLYSILNTEMTDYRGQRPQNKQANPTNGDNQQNNFNANPENRGARGRSRESGGNPERKRGGGNRNYQRDNNQDKPYDRNGFESKPENRGEKTGAKFYSWNNVFENLKGKNQDFKTITIEESTATVAQKFTFGNIRATDKYIFENETGEIIKTQLYNDQDGSTKLRGWIYSLHTGKWGGLFSKILTCIVAVMGGLLPLSGYYIYFVKYKRKKVKTKMQNT